MYKWTQWAEGLNPKAVVGLKFIQPARSNNYGFAIRNSPRNGTDGVDSSLRNNFPNL
jgi:hypothetical protein